MSLVIPTNVAALESQRNLQKNQANYTTSFNKLSSGVRTSGAAVEQEKDSVIRRQPRLDMPNNIDYRSSIKSQPASPFDALKLVGIQKKEVTASSEPQTMTLRMPTAAENLKAYGADKPKIEPQIDPNQPSTSRRLF